MEQHIKNQNIDTLFIKTLAKSYEMPNGKIQVHVYFINIKFT